MLSQEFTFMTLILHLQIYIGLIQPIHMRLCMLIAS